jgi:WD repeat-containing protein 61
MKNRINARRLANFTGHSGNIYALAVGEVSGNIYSGATDGMVIEWNLGEPHKGRLVARVSEPVFSLWLDEETQYLWIGVASGNLHVIDLGQKKELKMFALHTKGVFDIKPLGDLVWAAGGDGKLSSFHRFGLTQAGMKTISEKSLRVMAVHPNEAYVAFGSSDCSIYKVSGELEILEQKEMAHQNSVFSLDFARQGEVLLSGGRDAMLNIWKVEGGLSLAQSIPAHNLHVHCIAVNQENGLFITSSMDKTIKIWDSHSFELLRVMDKMRHQAHVNSINKIKWLDAQKFVSVSDDKSVMVWELDS